MNKCEWIEERVFNSESDHKFVFVPCDETKIMLLKTGYIVINSHDNYFNMGIIDFCPFCGADIRKPEPEPKSTISISDGYVEYIYPIERQDEKCIQEIYEIICKALDMKSEHGKIRTNKEPQK